MISSAKKSGGLFLPIFLFPPGTLIEQNAGGASGALGDFWPRLTQVGRGFVCL